MSNFYHALEKEKFLTPKHEVWMFFLVYIRSNLEYLPLVKIIEKYIMVVPKYN